MNTLGSNDLYVGKTNKWMTEFSIDSKLKGFTIKHYYFYEDCMNTHKFELQVKTIQKPHDIVFDLL